MNASAYYNPHSVNQAMALVRCKENPSLLELVQRDRDYCACHNYPVPSAVSLMREGIRDGLSAVTPGKGNRARRRAAVIGMQSHNRLWMHLNCA